MTLAVVLLVSVAFSCDCSRVSRRSTTNTNASSSAGAIFKSTPGNFDWIKTHANKILAQGVLSLGAIIDSRDFSFKNIAGKAAAFGIAALGVINPLLGAIAGLFLGIFKGLFGGGGFDLEETINLLISKRIWEERTQDIVGVFKAHAEGLADCCSPSQDHVQFLLKEADYIRRQQYKIFRECDTNVLGEDCRKWQTEGGGGGALEYALMFAESEIQIRIHIIGMSAKDKKFQLGRIGEYGHRYVQLLLRHHRAFQVYRELPKFLKYTRRSFAQHFNKVIQQRDTFADREMISSKCLRHGVEIQYQGFEAHQKACVHSYINEVIRPHLDRSFKKPIEYIRRLVYKAWIAHLGRPAR